MLRRVARPAMTNGNQYIAHNASANNAVVACARQVSNPKTDLTFFTYYMWPSWAMGIWVPLVTVWPMLSADIFRPSATASKLPILHAFHERRIDAKLRAAMDNSVTCWTEELDAAAIDSAVARTF